MIGKRVKYAKGKRGYKKESSRYLNQQSIFDEKGMIYTTPDSNGNYYFRTWIAEEGKYFRVSLRTKIKSDAKRKGEEMMLDIITKIKNGHKVFGMSWGDLCEDFLVRQLQRVETNRIKHERYLTIKTQINRWIIPYLTKSIRLSELDANVFLDYGLYRRKKTKNEVRDVTIRNEYTTINAIIRHGFRKGETPIQRFEVEEIKITDHARRDTFTPEEYKQFYVGMRDWVKESVDSYEKYYRSILRDFVLIKSNTFLRFGELVKIKWKMVKVTSHKGNKIIVLDLPKEICKNKKNRQVIARGGRYFERIKEYTENHKKEDYVFTHRDRNELISKSSFYKYFNQVMKYTGFDKSEKTLTFYSFRHFGITARLYAKVPIYEVAKLAGTEVRFIENHYEHLDMGKLRDSALQTFTMDKNGFVIRE